MNGKVNGLGIADILIIGAELLHELADEGMEATAQSYITLKSTEQRYKVSITVELADEDDEE